MILFKVGESLHAPLFDLSLVPCDPCLIEGNLGSHLYFFVVEIVQQGPTTSFLLDHGLVPRLEDRQLLLFLLLENDSVPILLISYTGAIAELHVDHSMGNRNLSLNFDFDFDSRRLFIDIDNNGLRFVDGYLRRRDDLGILQDRLASLLLCDNFPGLGSWSGRPFDLGCWFPGRFLLDDT